MYSVRYMITSIIALYEVIWLLDVMIILEYFHRSNYHLVYYKLTKY